jgi:hypothetical protein
VLGFRDAVADELLNKVVFAKDGERGQCLHKPVCHWRRNAIPS